MQLVEGIKLENTQPKKYAAMYYKTEPFHSDIRNYRHTNNWEILKACEILARKGFEIDLIDRSNKNWIPSKEYDLFLGLGVGNSGDQFVKYAKKSKAKKRVLLAQGPQPDASNERVIERYKMFNERTGRNAPTMRTVEKVIGSNFEEIIKNTDYILCIGEEGTNSSNSFLKYNIPVLNFYPAISNKIKFDNDWKKSRKRNHFLCFAGNGLICKGVDLVVESFLKNKDNYLHICGPLEGAFKDQYEKLINESENINYYGFIEPGGEKFNILASLCSYTIFHSSAEGCCTSVATAMKAGLVPVINSWTSINILDEINGFVLGEQGDIIDIITKKVNYVSKISDQKYFEICDKNLKHVTNFSQSGFTESYSKAIDKILT